MNEQKILEPVEPTPQKLNNYERTEEVRKALVEGKTVWIKRSDVWGEVTAKDITVEEYYSPNVLWSLNRPTIQKSEIVYIPKKALELLLKSRVKSDELEEVLVVWQDLV